MKHRNNIINRHLTKDEILIVLVDETKLDPDLCSHIKACTRCNDEKTRIEQQLSDLSHMAKQMVPAPTRRIRLPETRERSFFGNGWRLSPALGMMAAMVLVVILVWPQAKFYLHSFLGQDMRIQEIKKDDQLITAVSALVEDALPLKYQDILAAAETDFDQDFMQFIVPPIEENDFQSLSYNQRGSTYSRGMLPVERYCRSGFVISIT